MGYHCLNLEFTKQEKTSLYDWYFAIHNELEIKLCFEHSSLAGDDLSSMNVIISIRGNVIYNTNYRFISLNSVQHKLDEITNYFKVLNQHLIEIKI